jgi:hypothetical protein
VTQLAGWRNFHKGIAVDAPDEFSRGYSIELILHLAR